MRSSASTVSALFERVDERVIHFLSRHGIFFLRISLGLTFVWFGALKVFDVSPVAGLVTGTVYWLPLSVSSRSWGCGRYWWGWVCSRAVSYG